MKAFRLSRVRGSVATVLCAGMVLLGGVNPGCGGSDDDKAKRDGPERDASSTADAAAPMTTAVGPEGGIVTSADGNATLEIPAGALSEPTDITITGPFDGGILPDELQDLLPRQVYRLEPDGLRFDQAVTAAITIDERSLPAAAAPDHHLWGVFSAKEGGSDISGTAGFGERDGDRLTLYGVLEHFSVIAVGSGATVTLGTEPPCEDPMNAPSTCPVGDFSATATVALKASIRNSETPSGSLRAGGVKGGGNVVADADLPQRTLPIAASFVASCTEPGAGQLDLEASGTWGNAASIMVSVLLGGFSLYGTATLDITCTAGPDGGTDQDGGPEDAGSDVIDTGDGGSDYDAPPSCGGETCGGGQFCDQPDNICGASADATCVDRPAQCPPGGPVVCACDGNVYDNACEAALAGQDVSSQGGCAAPAGTFPCGETFCQQGSEHCRALGSAYHFSCEPFPADCGDSPSCECLTPTCSVPEPICEELESAGDFQLTCFGSDLDCAEDADCSRTGDAGGRPILGRCHVETGLCLVIEGHSALQPGELCDSSDDCSSGICDLAPPGVPTYNQAAVNYRAGGRNICTRTCDTSADCASIPDAYCRRPFFGSDPQICALPCARKEQCSALGTIECYIPTGECLPPGGPECLPGGSNQIEIAQATVTPQAIGAFGAGTLEIEWIGDWCDTVEVRYVQPANELFPIDQENVVPVSQASPLLLVDALICGSQAQAAQTTVTLINGNGNESAPLQVPFNCTGG